MQGISKLIILNKEAVEQNEKEGLKVGAGPFKFNNWITEDRIELELNENHHNKDAIKDSPKKITWRVMRDPDTALLNLSEGSIDAIFDFPIDQIQNARRQGVTVVENETAKCSYLFMNTKMTNSETRKLIAAALNIPKIIEDLGLPVTQLKAFVPPTSFAHNPDIPSHFNPNQMDEVKRQITALPAADRTIKFGFSAKEGEDVMNKIAEQLRNAGFTVETHRPDFNTFIENTLISDTYNMAFFSEAHVEPFGHKAMFDLMDPEQLNDKNQAHTFLSEKDPEVIRLLNEIKSNLSKEEFVTKVKRLQQIFHEKAFIVPFYKQNTVFLTNNKIQNFNCDSMSKTDLTKIRKSN
ncbi:ABC transporter substrate-binding protein [Candidatus Phytoplasma solani]